MGPREIAVGLPRGEPAGIARRAQGSRSHRVPWRRVHQVRAGGLQVNVRKPPAARFSQRRLGFLKRKLGEADGLGALAGKGKRLVQGYGGRLRPGGNSAGKKEKSRECGRDDARHGPASWRRSAMALCRIRISRSTRAGPARATEKMTPITVIRIRARL